MALGCAFTQSIQQPRDACVRHEAGKRADYPFDLQIRLPTVTTRLVLTDFQFGMITTLPMKHESNPMIANKDDDLLQDQTSRIQIFSPA